MAKLGLSRDPTSTITWLRVHPYSVLYGVENACLECCLNAFPASGQAPEGSEVWLKSQQGACKPQGQAWRCQAQPFPVDLLQSSVLFESALKTLCCGQVEEAAKEKLELSRELASLRARLSAVTLQAQQREAKAQAAERAADVAERAEQHAAALEAAQREISALKEQLAQAEASTVCRSLFACTLLSTFATRERIAECKCCILVRLKAASSLIFVLNEHPYRFDTSSLCHSCSECLTLIGHDKTHRGSSA